MSREDVVPLVVSGHVRLRKAGPDGATVIEVNGDSLAEAIIEHFKPKRVVRDHYLGVAKVTVELLMEPSPATAMLWAAGNAKENANDRGSYRTYRRR